MFIIFKNNILIFKNSHTSQIVKICTAFMGKRVTILIDEDLDKKLRRIQVKYILKEQTSYSYSRTVNNSLRKVLK